MKRITLALVILASTAFAVPSSSAASTCTSLNVPTVAEDGTTVTMTSINLLEKTGSIQLTISYKLLNATADKKLNEGSFKIFYDDGTSTPQYGFFGYLFPGDSLIRSHTWEYLKSALPLVISYNAGFFSNSASADNLNWAIPGKPCVLVSSADKAAADKAAADKAAADKAAAEKTAADKAAAEKTAADKAAADKAAADKAAADKAAAEKTAADKAAADKAAAEKTASDKAAADKAAAEKTASDKAAADKAAAEKTAADKAAAEKILVMDASSQIRGELNSLAQQLLSSLQELLSRTSSATIKKEILGLQYEVNREIKEFNQGILFQGALVEMYKTDLANLNAKYLKLKGTTSSKVTITCVKGKLIKKVTALKPVCPSGYKKK
jgi:hypothetical protein